MKNSLRIHKWTHNEFNIFILGVLTHPLGVGLFIWLLEDGARRPPSYYMLPLFFFIITLGSGVTTKFMWVCFEGL